MKSYYIHFFRNGETVADGNKQYIGVTDVELSTNGISLPPIEGRGKQ